MNKKEKEIINENLETLKLEGFSFKSVKGKGLEIEHKSKPDIVLGYVPMSHYDSTFESQYEMMRTILDLYYHTVITMDDISETFNLPEECDAMIEGTREWFAIHGNGKFIEEGTSISGRIDGRLHFISELDLDIFWNDIESFGEYLDEIDPNDIYAVTHRKGKDWYISYAYSLYWLPMEYTLPDTEGIFDTDVEFGIIEDKDKNNQIYKQLNEALYSTKMELDIKGFISISLNGSDFEPSFPLTDMFPKLDEYWEIIFDRIYEQLYTKAHTITFFDVESVGKNVINDLIIEEQKELRFDEILNDLEFHIKNLKCKLVYSKLFEGSDRKSYAIKRGKYEYHFTPLELLEYEYMEEFAWKIYLKLQDLILENKNIKDFKEKAKKVFVSIQDSTKSGNCEVGTKQWAYDQGINLYSIGGVRGDYLLEMDPTSPRVRKAVNHAIKTKLSEEII